MGLFNFIKKPEKTILEALNIDLSKYPDESFIIDKTNPDKDKVVYRKLLIENKMFGIFSDISVITFNNLVGKNLIFHCYTYEFDKYDLPDFIIKIYDVYGKDDSGNGLYTRNDSEEIENDTWLGRTWQNDKFPIACAINYFEEDGLTFTIWTT
jgi:hypothetical protein